MNPEAIGEMGDEERKGGGIRARVRFLGEGSERKARMGTTGPTRARTRPREGVSTEYAPGGATPWGRREWGAEGLPMRRGEGLRTEGVVAA